VRKKDELQPVRGVSQNVFDEQRLYEKEYFKQLTAARQSVEWGNGTWQKLYERLTRPLPAVMNGTRRATLAATMLIFNFRVRRCGHLGTQIASVFGLIFE
jgi:hypothetical protein